MNQQQQEILKRNITLGNGSRMDAEKGLRVKIDIEDDIEDDIQHENKDGFSTRKRPIGGKNKTVGLLMRERGELQK